MRYRAYGLSIESELALPELLPASAGGRPDVVIRLGTVGPRPPAAECENHAYAVAPDTVCFSWEVVGAFQVSNGAEIVVEPIAGADEDLVRLPLLGSVFGVLLHQRGLLPLHASAVAVDGRAALFLGSKGEGKSTTAALLYGRGHAVVSDDISAITFDRDGRPLVWPAFPQLKLFDDAAAGALGDDPERLPRLAALIEKRARRSDDRFPDAPVPVAAVIVLGDGPVVALTRLAPMEAVSELVGSSIAGRFGRDLLDGADAVDHFRRCTDLLRAAPAHRLARPRDLGGLGAVAEAVEGLLRQPAGALR